MPAPRIPTPRRRAALGILRRLSHGSAGRSFWGAGGSKIHHCTAQDLVLHLQAAFLPPQPHQFGLLRGQYPLHGAIIKIGLAYPAADCLLSDSEISSDFQSHQITPTVDGDHILLELIWVLLWHNDVLPAGPKSRAKSVQVNRQQSKAIQVRCRILLS